MREACTAKDITYTQGLLPSCMLACHMISKEATASILAIRRISESTIYVHAHKTAA